MSRSYKKNPYVTDNGDTKMSKRIANRRVRRAVKNDDSMPARLPHKKMTESWDICDYRWRMTREDAIKEYNRLIDRNPSDRFMKRYPTLEVWLKDWEKNYKRK